ncbi:LANO_0E10066g1_1 [Lachancea nothofagi CBS 11611]|uniref:Cyclin-dependent kinase 8 n=1 Tax=Lachancea nothofagi CBS 11611 TaxID=1266666 RepID=A0A1G4JWM6_9SACH|nr:LANO_0E10066g1_1 [Lachancea nothofagi CBS 11611]
MNRDMYSAQNQASNLYQQSQPTSQTIWQQQMADSKGCNSNSSKPLLMANNNVFSIGPYKKRKDANRVSVVEKYEIIGYIAAGTYGKVYKARKKNLTPNGSTSSSTDSEVSSVPVSKNPPPNGHEALDVNSINKSTRVQDPSTSSMSINAQQEMHSDHKVQSSKKSHDNNTSGSIMIGPPLMKLPSLYAIKKFKTEREGVEQLHYTGISQSACREMSLCRELRNKHLTHLVEIFLEHKSIYMVSEFAEHDLLQIIHFHSHPEKRLIPPRMLKSILWQILDGVSYLHQNWILHRDLKPANIMVTVDGCVKIGDLGLARKFHNMVQTLYTGDKVVVTIWYRAPELLLGARHYTPAIDLWAVGCIFAELIGLRPIFKGEEAKMDSKKSVPFQANQLQRILEVLGSPTEKSWPDIYKYPECEQLSKFPRYRDNLPVWYHSAGGRNKEALELLYQLLRYDPITRIDAVDALEHPYFTNEAPTVCENVFEGLNYKYPPRRIHTNDNDIMNISNTKAKATATNPQAIASKNAANASLGGLGVNRRILAAAAAAAAAVSGTNSSTRPGSSTNVTGPLRKKRR